MIWLREIPYQYREWLPREPSGPPNDINAGVRLYSSGEGYWSAVDRHRKALAAWRADRDRLAKISPIWPANWHANPTWPAKVRS